MAINYAEKGIGMHAAIAAAGHWIEQRGGAWVVSDEEAVQAIIDAYSLDQAKADKSREVTLHAKALRDKVVAAISPGELASWPVKLSEAAKFAGGADAAQCPMLSGEALARGEFSLTGSPASLTYSSDITYARAPSGAGYAPQRIEAYARPASSASRRPAATQRNNR